MSLYSSIDRRINADAWFRELSEGAQLLFFRLLTGSHVTPVPGLWAATEEGLARAFKLSLDTFRERFAELSRDRSSKGLPRVLADWNAGVIWLPNSLDFPCNQPKNPNALASWKNHLELMPECGLKLQALRVFESWVNERKKRFKRGWPYGSMTRSLNGSANHGAFVPSQEQEQKQDQDQEVERARPSAPAAPAPTTSKVRPHNLNEALALPLAERAGFIERDRHLADWLEPHVWPEVVAVAQVLHDNGGGRGPLRLAAYARDAGVRALITLFAAGFEQAELELVARTLPTRPYWTAGGCKPRSLGALTVEVVRRELAELQPPPETVSETRIRLRNSARQPGTLAQDASDAELLALVGGQVV